MPVCDQILVSCIINFFNAEKFIEEAIQSVFSQTHQRWELLLIDDGSVDESTQIAKDHAQNYPERVHYFEHENHQNKGTSASRNLGIKNAKGDYIAFLDADDIWLPNKLQRQVLALEEHPEASMTYGPLYYWYSWTGKKEDIDKDYIAEIWNFPPNTILRFPDYLPLFVREKILIPPPCSILARKEVLQKIGGFEESFRDLFDDQVFVAKISLEAPILLTHESLDRYRKHPDSCTALISNEKVYKFREIYLTWLENYVISLRIRDKNLLKAIRGELLPYRKPYLSKLLRKLRSFQELISRFKQVILRKEGSWID